MLSCLLSALLRHHNYSFTVRVFFFIVSQYMIPPFFGPSIIGQERTSVICFFIEAGCLFSCFFVIHIVLFCYLVWAATER